jgi:hypothetical protein
MIKLRDSGFVTVQYEPAVNFKFIRTHIRYLTIFIPRILNL